MKNHPKYICDDLYNLNRKNLVIKVSLSEITKRPIINYLRGYKDKYLVSNLDLKFFINFTKFISSTVKFLSLHFQKF